MKLYGRIARAYNYSVTEMKYRVKFVETYADFDEFISQFSDISEIPTWFEVCHKYLYEKSSKSNKKAGTTALPKGKFDIIYADPPWQYEYNLRGTPENHYPTMKLEEICKLKIPVAKNAILFLWATAPKIEEALQVMESWKFDYKTNMVWVKDKIGLGHYFRGQHELLFLGEKGDMPCPGEADRHSSVVSFPRLEHSEKPPVVYEIIERMYPNRGYLELFATTERKGWESWGLEISPKILA